MKALLKTNNGLVYSENVEQPTPKSDEVLIKVMYAGICKTDLYVACGKIDSVDNIVLGHECVGRVVEYGKDTPENAKIFPIGHLVTFNPMDFIPSPRSNSLSYNTMCGKDCNGCFAEYVSAPIKACYDADIDNTDVPTLMMAYTEPINAALAPYTVIDSRKPCAVVGKGRIAELAYELGLALHFDVSLVNPDELEYGSYSQLIEAEATVIETCIDNVTDNGLVIVKSRSYREFTVEPNMLAMRNITLRGVRYGDWNTAIELGSHCKLDTDKLFGNVYRLSEFQQAFAEAINPKSKKIFFNICAE